MSGLPVLAQTTLLLIGSNVFMTFAWYGHLAYREKPLWIVVLASWMIALPEYWLAVPANRYGSYVFSGAELKAMQEVITLSVFAIFSITSAVTFSSPSFEGPSRLIQMGRL